MAATGIAIECVCYFYCLFGWAAVASVYWIIMAVLIAPMIVMRRQYVCLRADIETARNGPIGAR